MVGGWGLGVGCISFLTFLFFCFLEFVIVVTPLSRAVKVFYGEFDDTQPEVFFSSLANFVVDFERARKDNEDSRARSKKKKLIT